MIGETFGRLIVLRLLGTNNRWQRVWLCKCSCGNTHRVRTAHLRSGAVRSCGCLRNETLAKYRRSAHQLEFERFGKLIALQADGKGRNYRWICECDCGRLIRVWTHSLTSGKSQSCGCGRKQGTLKSLHQQMLRRCYDKRATGFSQYGAKGVRVCSHWKVFKNFERDMSPRPNAMSLARFRDTGNYSCGRCAQCRKNGWVRNARWATAQQQGRDRRMRKRLTRFKQVA